MGGLAVIALLILGVLYILYRRKPAKPAPAAAADATIDPIQPPPPGQMAVHDYQGTSPQMVHNYDSFISEMPGSIPDKASWSPDMHGGGGSVPTAGDVTPGYDAAQHRQVGGVSPLLVEGHVVQGYNGVDHGQVAGTGEGTDIV